MKPYGIWTPTQVMSIIFDDIYGGSRDTQTQRIDVYICNIFFSSFTSETWKSKKLTYTYIIMQQFFVFYVEDVKIKKKLTYTYATICCLLRRRREYHQKNGLVIFSIFCTQWPWRDTQTQTVDVYICEFFFFFYVKDVNVKKKIFKYSRQIFTSASTKRDTQT